jgi:hypothetical protein
MFITALSGISLGLVISSLVADAKTAANFVPLVLIPQLIFGGALIKYEEMNKNLDIIYTFKRWFSTHPEIPNAGTRNDAQFRVPFLSRLVATHYSYEALIVAQAKLNPLAFRQDRLQDRIDRLVQVKRRTREESAQLEDFKEALAMLSGLECASVVEIEKRLRRVDRVIDGAKYDPSSLRSKTTGLSAERLYTNQKVNDLVAKAETEQNDYRRHVRLNVFFGPIKTHYLGPRSWPFVATHPVELSVYTRNSLVLGASSLVCLAGLYGILKRQLRTRGI